MVVAGGRRRHGPDSSCGRGGRDNRQNRSAAAVAVAVAATAGATGSAVLDMIEPYLCLYICGSDFPETGFAPIKLQSFYNLP